MSCSFKKYLLQRGKWGVGVGICLKICDVAAGSIFGGNQLFCLFNLLGYAKFFIGGKFPGAASTAENAAAGIQSAVAVWAGKAGIEGKLVQLCAEAFPAVVIKAVVAFAVPHHFNGYGTGRQR